MKCREPLEERAAKGAVAVLYCDGPETVLRVARRDPVDNIRLIECPGGGREAGEHTLDTALREAGEELGLSPELLGGIRECHAGVVYVQDGGRTLVDGTKVAPSVHALHFFHLSRKALARIIVGFCPNSEATEIKPGLDDVTDTFRMSRLARTYFVPAIEEFIRAH